MSEDGDDIHNNSRDCSSSLLSSEIIDNEDYHREQLELLFGNGHWEINAEDPPRVLQILKACPILASETFEDAGGEWMSPLCFMMTSRSACANLELIKQLHALCPEALSLACGQEEELPLHMACWRAIPRPVVEFLALQCPEGLLRRTHCGLLPIHLALIRAGRDDNFRAAALEIVQALLELYPELIPNMNGPDGESLLEFVFSFAYRKDLVDFVWERHPHQQVQKFSVDRTTATESAPALDLQQAIVLEHLLPQLTHFECFPRRWTTEAFIFLVECLQKCTTLESLGLRIPLDILFTDPNALSAFQNLLIGNRHLKKICLSGGRIIDVHGGHDNIVAAALLDGSSSADGDSRLLQVIARCLLQNHHNLDTLLLSDLIIPDRSLADFLMTGILPRQKLAFYRVALTGEWDCSAHDDKLQYSWEHSQVKSLTFFTCPMQPKALKNLLVQCSRMPSLRHLAIGMKDQASMGTSQELVGLDVTDSVVELLDRAPQLQMMTIRGPVVRSKELAEALKRNTTLRHYTGTPSSDDEQELSLVADVLEHHNTTLEGFEFDLNNEKGHSSSQEKISHFTKLNDFGRLALRKGYINRAEFVQFLCFAAVKPDFETEDVFNVHYGLLRELPTLWCHGALERFCGAKRKCMECCHCITDM